MNVFSEKYGRIVSEGDAQRKGKYTCRCTYPARSADDLFNHTANADDDQQHGSK